MTGPAVLPKPRRKRARHPRLAIGDRVHYAEGTATGTGTVDAVTSDYSIIWVLTDEGLGRRMFLQGYDSIVSSVEEEASDDGAGPGAGPATAHGPANAQP